MANYSNQNAHDGSFIEINTATMRYYSERLMAVNKRITALENRIQSLYMKAGWKDLNKLIKSDCISSYEWHITNCSRYLSETANDFDGVERVVSSLY